jgi:hypothetical protein
MKKAILLAMCLVLIGVGAAMADTIIPFSNTTTVTESGTLTDFTYPNVIGSSDYFATPGGQYNVTTKVLTINTNWDPQKDTHYATGYTDSRVTTAFLFVKQGSNLWAINLEASADNVFVQPSTDIKTSYDIFASAPLGGYGESIAGEHVPVAVTGTTTFDIAVAWTLGDALHPLTSTGNSFALDLSGLPNFQSGVGFNILWGTAQCANGPITENFSNVVPLPPSALLLGSGLLGLVGLGWRRRKTDV